MSPEVLLTIGLSTVIGLLGFLGKALMARLQAVEQEVDQKISERQTRQILADKLEPLKDGLDDVKDKLDKLYDLLLK